MSCRFRESDRWTAWVDDELPAAERAGLERHLKACPACRATVRELRRAAGLVRALPELRAPAGFRRRLLDRLADDAAVPTRGSPRDLWSTVLSLPRRTRIWAGAAAAAVLLLAGALGLQAWLTQASRTRGVITEPRPPVAPPLPAGKVDKVRKGAEAVAPAVPAAPTAPIPPGGPAAPSATPAPASPIENEPRAGAAPSLPEAAAPAPPKPESFAAASAPSAAPSFAEAVEGRSAAPPPSATLDAGRFLAAPEATAKETREQPAGKPKPTAHRGREKDLRVAGPRSGAKSRGAPGADPLDRGGEARRTDNDRRLLEGAYAAATARPAATPASRPGNAFGAPGAGAMNASASAPEADAAEAESPDWSAQALTEAPPAPPAPAASPARDALKAQPPRLATLTPSATVTLAGTDPDALLAALLRLARDCGGRTDVPTLAPGGATQRVVSVTVPTAQADSFRQALARLSAGETEPKSAATAEARKEGRGVKTSKKPLAATGGGSAAGSPAATRAAAGAPRQGSERSNDVGGTAGAAETTFLVVILSAANGETEPSAEPASSAAPE